MKRKIYVLCGKSGSGKDTVYRAVQGELGLLPIVSTTTRPMRPSEKEGVEYYFISDEEFKEMESKDEFIETRYYNTIQDGKEAIWYYGISKGAIDLDKGDHIVIVDLNGLEELIAVYGDSVVAIYIHVEDEERERRAILRGGYEEAEWNRRLEDDNIQFNYERINKNVNFIVHNLELGATVRTVKNIIENVSLLD